MKKFLLYSLMALAVMVCGFYALIHQKASQTHAPALVGEETLLFLHCPDIRQSRTRWTNTALYQIANEPEVRAFLEKPKGQLPKAGEVRSRLHDFVLADPREAFFALASVEKIPVFVAGALCLGDKGKVDSALAELTTTLQSQWPQGQRGETRYAGVSIQTFTQGKSAMASAWVGRWILVSDDLGLIKKTIDRAQRNSTHGLLAENADYKKSLSHMPSHPELITYLRPDEIAQGFASIQGKKTPLLSNSLADLKQMRALCMGLKFDGENIRDAFFTLIDHPAKQPGLTRQSLQLTTSDTLVYFAGLMDLNRVADKMARLSQSTPAVPIAMAALQAGLANQGITLESLAAMLGNEYGFAVDWPAVASQPSLMFSMDLKDRAMAAKTVQALTDGQMGGSWEHTKSAGSDLFTLSQLPMATPALAITDKSLIFGSDAARVKSLTSSPAVGGGLATTPPFKNAEKLLNKPTQSFGYIDSRALFERIYSTSRPLIMLWGGFNPTVRNAVDLNKLPPTETISKHLQPIAYSSSNLPDGLLMESIGPVTFTQTALVAGIGIGAAVVPIAKPYLGGRSSH